MITLLVKRQLIYRPYEYIAALHWKPLLLAMPRQAMIPASTRRNDLPGEDEAIGI